jgi:hypothetical protein
MTHPYAQTSDGNELLSGGSKQSSGASHLIAPRIYANQIIYEIQQHIFIRPSYKSPLYHLNQTPLIVAKIHSN